MVDFCIWSMMVINFYIKIIELNKIYNFADDKLFNWTYLECHKCFLDSYILKFKN